MKPATTFEADSIKAVAMPTEHLSSAKACYSNELCATTKSFL